MSHSNDRFALDRRDVLYLLGSAAAVGLFGCGRNSVSGPTSPSASTSSSAATPPSNLMCVVKPELIEGPNFVDERLNRSDIRSDPTTGVVSPGVPLTLAMQLSQISASGSCSPLAGALVDMWHCDALGVYSDISADNTVGQKFLRGYQLSDANGLAQFTTIYPGWRQGRAVHIHFKVRTTSGSPTGLEFTSMMFFDEPLTDRVYSQAPYRSRGRRDTPNSSDESYQTGGSQLVIPLFAAGDGYDGALNIGVRV